MELKQLHEEMLATHNTFKAYVDKELEEIKKNGQASVETKAALDKLNDRLSELDRQNTARIDSILAKMANPESGGSNKSATPEIKAYIAGFDSYLRRGQDKGLAELETKAMMVASDPAGGYMVHPDMSGRIVQKIFDTTPMRQIAAVQPIGTDSLEGIVDRDETDVGWVGETAARAETATPDIGKWRISVHELYAEPRATQKFLDDAEVDVEAWLEAKLSDKLSREQNNKFINGNGITQPRGIVTYTTAATADDTRAWQVLEHIATGNAADFPATNPADKLFDVIYALKAGYRMGARWLMPKAVLGKIRKFKEATTNAYLWQPGLQEGQPSLLLGYPLVESEDMPALASGSLSVAFGNFKRGYLIVDRSGIRTLRDPYTAKPHVKFYTTIRVGGDVNDFDAIKLIKFS